MKIEVTRAGEIFVTSGTLYCGTAIWDFCPFYDMSGSAWSPKTKITLEVSEQ